MSFTKTDKALIDRAARHLSEAAVIEKNSYGTDWTVDAECKAAKRRYDRLLRDERDLRELGRRLVVEKPATILEPQRVERRSSKPRRLPPLQIWHLEEKRTGDHQLGRRSE